MMIEATLRQAVERLEARRDGAPSGPWELYPFWSSTVLYADLDLDRSTGYGVVNTPDAATAMLVATLHRTIDAQLLVLRAGLQWFDDYEGATDRDYKIAPEGRATLALAEAILGES